MELATKITPTGFNTVAQGKRRSCATLGRGASRMVHPERVLQGLSMLFNPFRVDAGLLYVTQGGALLTLGYDVKPLRGYCRRNSRA